jgi:hypothetical protein
VVGAGPRLLADTHVHFHGCFTWGAFLAAAAANFARARRRLGLTAASPGCLMFTESAAARAFREFDEGPAFFRSLGWVVERGDEGSSRVLTHRGGDAILVIAGRQIVTAEHLEVLALGFVDEIADGRPIRDVVCAVRDRGAVAAIPWGFGKWWGRRGRLLRHVIETETLLYLSDNGGRAGVLPRSRTFAWAEQRGVPTLAGSDPLPLRSHEARAGSYGCILDDWRPTASPANVILARLHALTRSPATFGRLSSLPAMIQSQAALRLRGRHGRPAPTTAPV